MFKLLVEIYIAVAAIMAPVMYVVAEDKKRYKILHSVLLSTTWPLSLLPMMIFCLLSIRS